MIRVKRSHFDAFENNDPIGMRCSPHSPKNIEENEKFVNIALPFKKFKMDSDDKFQITRKTKKTVKKNRSDKSMYFNIIFIRLNCFIHRFIIVNTIN